MVSKGNSALYLTPGSKMLEMEKRANLIKLDIESRTVLGAFEIPLDYRGYLTTIFRELEIYKY